MDNERVFHAALSKWGVDSQVSMAMGECGELIAALNAHFTQGKEPIENVIDEIADVEIMCAQLRLIVGSEQVSERKEYKIERLSKILSGQVNHPHSIKRG